MLHVECSRARLFQGDSIESQQAVLTDETMDILCGTVIR